MQSMRNVTLAALLLAFALGGCDLIGGDDEPIQCDESAETSESSFQCEGVNDEAAYRICETDRDCPTYYVCVNKRCLGQ